MHGFAAGSIKIVKSSVVNATVILHRRAGAKMHHHGASTKAPDIGG
jgi:hypothetical protein